MAENKKYYWLKLKNNFFSQPKIKKLRKIAGGDTYTIIYLKMQLLSLQNSAKLYFDGIEENFAEEIALTIDEDIENVKVTIQYLISQGLLEEINQDEFVLPETLENIGSETRQAGIMRRKRTEERIEESNIVTPLLPTVTNCYTEIEIEKEKDIEKDIEIEKSKKKHKHGEYSHVLLTDDELAKLQADYPNCDELIIFLDEYIEMKGYKAKSHYLAIKKWVVAAVNERKPKQTSNQAFLDKWKDA